MKEYGDESFIHKMVHNQNVPQYEGNDIRNGVADVDGNEVAFCERSIIEDRLYMTIPAEFELMPAWMVKKTHPYESRPDIIFADEKALNSVNFWLKDNPPDNKETESVLEHILTNVNPEHKIINTVLVCNFFELEKDGEKGLRIGYFELVTDNDDEEISDLTFFFPLDGQFMIGSFKCISVDLPKWVDAVEQMLRTIRMI